jgi:hypothetical protein
LYEEGKIELEEAVVFGKQTALIEMPISWFLDDFVYFEFLRTQTSVMQEPRSFPGFLPKVALMASDYRAVREKVMTRFPIMRSNAFERHMLFQRADGQHLLSDATESACTKTRVKAAVSLATPHRDARSRGPVDSRRFRKLRHVGRLFGEDPTVEVRFDHLPGTHAGKRARFSDRGFARSHPFAYAVEELPDPDGVHAPSPPGGDVEDWLAKFVTTGRSRPTGQLLMTLNEAIAEGFSYKRRSSHGTQTPGETLQSQQGTCRTSSDHDR